MHSTSTPTLGGFRVLLPALAILLFVPALAFAQNPPGLETADHYKVYSLATPQFQPVPVVLRDQFGTATTDVLGPVFLSPPVRKNNEPWYDERTHYDWYRIFTPEPERTILYQNQFGEDLLKVFEGVFLMTPSLKNEPLIQPFPPLPKNHYKCYRALGSPILRHVVLETQFGFESVDVLEPELLCNPAEKHHLGQIHPIIDDRQHLVCYRIAPPVSLDIGVFIQDQFGFTQGQVLENRWLCVPSLKSHPVGAEETTWGRVKAMYN